MNYKHKNPHFRPRREDGSFARGPFMPKLPLRGVPGHDWLVNDPMPGLERDPDFGQSANFSSLDMSFRKRSRSTNAPVSTTTVVRLDAASREITLSGREFYRDVITPSTSYARTADLLRPTDFTLFSWLAGIAHKFEEYKFHKFTLTYEPQCPTSEAGCVGLYFDSDPTHADPPTWNHFIGLPATTHGAVWAKQSLNVPKHLFSSRRSYYIAPEYIDTNASATSLKDPLEYFPGKYGFCFEGCSASASVPKGKIYVEYTITLKIASSDGLQYLQGPAGSAVVLSGETAENSGIGLSIMERVPLAATAMPMPNGTAPSIIGYTTAALAAANPMALFGSCMFTYNGLDNSLIAKADLEFYCVTYATCTAAKTWANGFPVIQVSQVATPTTYANATAANAIYTINGSTPRVTVTTSVLMSCYVKLGRGMGFRILGGSTDADVYVTSYRVMCTPCLFGISG